MHSSLSSNYLRKVQTTMMNFIAGPRDFNLRRELVGLSSRTGIPILTSARKAIEKYAEQEGLEIPKPISWFDWHYKGVRAKEIYIDDLETILQHLLNGTIPKCVTIEMPLNNPWERDQDIS